MPPPLTEIVDATRPSAAEEARTIAASTNTGTLATLTAAGDPWASFVTYGLLEGAPVLCVSHMAEHGRNLAGDPRASLAVVAPTAETDPLASGRITLAGVAERPAGAEFEAARKAHLAAVAAAKYYIDYSDFSVWVLRVHRVRWVGGYGRMDSATGADYVAAQPDPIRPLAAGAGAGIAAAFNAPLAGVVFAIEELSNHMESRYSGVIISAIVLAGLLGVSAFGNAAYFGIITVPPLTWATLAPGLTVAIVTGLAGGLFAKLLLASLTGQSGDRITPLRQKYPVRFAAAIGFVIALIGLVSHGQTYGGGTEAARELLNGQTHEVSGLFGLLKFIATWLSAWSGVPGGLFAPSLSVGAGIGYNVSSLFGSDVNIAIVAMGMTGFLAAVTQAPLTAFIIVMEMIDGRPMVLSLMAVAMISATLSRMISRPLYHTLGTFMLAQFRAEQAVHAAQPETAETPAADANAPPEAEASAETADAPQAASAGEPAAQEAGALPQAGAAEAAAPQAMLPGMEAPTAPAAAPDAVSDAAAPPASSGPSPAAATPPPAAPSPQTPPSPPSP